MGEARRRGTFEERKAAAIKRAEEAKKNQPQLIAACVSPKERNRQAEALLTALGVMLYRRE